MPVRFDTRAITVMVQQGTAPAARSKALAQAAREGVAELIRSGQASPRYTRFVDGQEGRDEEAVKPEGVIAYRFAYLGEVAAFALAYLQGRSPARSGEYRRSFMVAVNGRPIPAAQFRPASVPEDASLFLYSPEPYSRKLDVQLIGGKRLRISVPSGIFEDAAKAVRGRYGNIVSAKRLYTLRFPGQERTRKGRAIEYPALEISPR